MLACAPPVCYNNTFDIPGKLCPDNAQNKFNEGVESGQAKVQLVQTLLVK